MKKMFFTFILVLSTPFCLGMQESVNDSTRLNSSVVLIDAFKGANITSALTLIQDGHHASLIYKQLLKEISKSFHSYPDSKQYDDQTEKHIRLLLSDPYNPAIYGILFYEKIAPALIEKIGQQGLTDSLLTAAQNQSLEKVEFLLKKYSNQLSQETLNRTIEATLTTERSFYSDDGPSTTLLRENLIFRHQNPKATRNNIALIELLKKYGAELSPSAASKALEDFQSGTNVIGDDGYCGVCTVYPKNTDALHFFYNQANSSCNQTRRDTIKFFLSQGGVFETSCKNDCYTACNAPSIQIDLHRVGKPFTVCSALGFVVGCLMCCPCNTLAVARSMIPEEPISLASIMPPSAVPMDHTIEAAPLTKA